jgi:hypothetical protein
VDRRTIANLSHRLHATEEQLALKSYEVIEKRNQIQDLQQQLLGALAAVQALEARLAADARSIQQGKAEVVAGITLVSKLSTENAELRSLVTQLSVLAKQEARRTRFVKFAQESEDVAMAGELRSRMMLYHLRTAQPTKELQAMAMRHALAMAKWEGRRRELLEQQRQQALAVLASMDLLRKDLVAEYEMGLPRNAPGFKVTSIQKRLSTRKTNTRTGETDQSGTKSGLPEVSSVPSIEQALVTANAHNQRLGRSLRGGVVASPLSTG